MPYELFLAFRYLRSRRKRRLARATAVAAVVGIAIGVGALIVALALANGFRDEMRSKILTGTAHITVMRTDGQAILDYQQLTSRLCTLNGVVNAAGTTYDGAVASGPKGSAFAVLRGIDTRSEYSAQEIKNWIVEGTIEPLFAGQAASAIPNVVVGAELATRIGLRPGEVVDLIPAELSAQNSTARWRARVAGVFRSGLFEYDSTWIYLPLDAATALAKNGHTASVISIEVNQLDQVKAIAANIRSTLGSGYTTVDWQEANKPLFAALALERRMGLFIVALIIVMATLNITSMLILVVVERRSDIAILKAMGARKVSVSLLFMIEGAAIGAIGAIIGVGLGLLVCVIGNRYQLVRLPADVYSIGNVPFNARASEILLAALLAFALSVLATVYPARAAARLSTTEILRNAG